MSKISDYFSLVIPSSLDQWKIGDFTPAPKAKAKPEKQEVSQANPSSAKDTFVREDEDVTLRYKSLLG